MALGESATWPEEARVTVSGLTFSRAGASGPDSRVPHAVDGSGFSSKARSLRGQPPKSESESRTRALSWLGCRLRSRLIARWGATE